MNEKQRLARIAELEKIFAEHEICERNGAIPYYDENGKLKVDMATCGTCHTSWNDALGSTMTPAPSARCPYEYIHPELLELRRLRIAQNNHEIITGRKEQAE